MNNQNIKIKIYSTPDCAYCYTVKEYLRTKNLEYEEIDIFEDQKGRIEMERISGQKNVPVTIINEEIIISWDKTKIDQILNKYGV